VGLEELANSPEEIGRLKREPPISLLNPPVSSGESPISSREPPISSGEPPISSRESPNLLEELSGSLIHLG